MGVAGASCGVFLGLDFALSHPNMKDSPSAWSLTFMNTLEAESVARALPQLTIYLVIREGQFVVAPGQGKDEPSGVGA